jgi:hypothetical protein
VREIKGSDCERQARDGETRTSRTGAATDAEFAATLFMESLPLIAQGRYRNEHLEINKGLAFFERKLTCILAGE